MLVAEVYREKVRYFEQYAQFPNLLVVGSDLWTKLVEEATLFGMEWGRKPPRRLFGMEIEVSSDLADEFFVGEHR